MRQTKPLPFAENNVDRRPAHRLGPATTTAVYDTFWRFAAERQAVFFRRVSGCDPPWTDDPILLEHKFTNAYRAADRVSQYLLRHVIYRGDTSVEETFFRTLLFKLFNRIETWQLLIDELGDLSSQSYSFSKYDRVLTKALNRKDRVYSAAYVMPAVRLDLATERKHQGHLHLLEKMMAEGLPQRIAAASSMEEGYRMLLEYPSIGNFLAYQYITDLNYSTITSFSEMQFVVPGPGALDGIHKCFSSLGGLSEAEVIRSVADNQRAEFERLGLQFTSLWGRDLQLIDCQNLFCEVSKYARVRHPDVAGRSGRTRIKQRYRRNPAAIDYFFPPKWNLDVSDLRFAGSHGSAGVTR